MQDLVEKERSLQKKQKLEDALRPEGEDARGEFLERWAETMPSATQPRDDIIITTTNEMTIRQVTLVLFVVERCRASRCWFRLCGALEAAHPVVVARAGRRYGSDRGQLEPLSPSWARAPTWESV